VQLENGNRQRHMIKNFNVMMVHANHKPCMCYDMTYQIIIITNIQHTS
jgi:hypothetical protein